MPLKPYTLADLKHAVDWTIENNIKYHGKLEEIPVLITLSEPSIGGRAFARVTGTGMGFDWEHGQFRITPDKNLVSEGKTMDDAIPCTPMIREGQRTSYFCSHCWDKVSKDDNFCRSCGQRMR